MPGKLLGGRYQVQDKIGTGGMATVFRGTDQVLGRTVAIKTMLPQYATDPSFAARFKQEAQAAAALQSPYIVSVYDWGKDADTYYIVMEYLRGTDLKSGIRKHGALDCKKVAQIGSQIAQALSVAHRHDIIHRDIKPQNIMVQPDGNIKVMDFGIARAKNSHLTQDNSVLGTAHYVSPEQTQGKELGPTTDIYSLGIVMYEAATGQVPFQGDDAISVALKQVNEQPKPPSQLNPAVDPALESIILKCMQKDPAARFQTADELNRTLRDYMAGRIQNVSSATTMIPAAATNRLNRSAVPPIAGGTATMSRAAASSQPGSTGRLHPVSATEEAEQTEAERKRKRKRNIGIGVVLSVVAVVVAIVAGSALLGSNAAMKDVPNLLGYTQAQAEQAIKDAGFTVGEVQEKYDNSTEKGKVCEQNPSANRSLKAGSPINIWISKGETPAEKVNVPDLVNTSAESANDALAKYNLTGAVGGYENSDEVPEGKVTRTDPPAGKEVDAGTPVKYWISKGPEKGSVPTGLVGKSYDVVKSALEKSGLVVKYAEEASDNVAKGMVISLNPGEGAEVEKGATVTVTVSTGPKTTMVNVPSVVGQSYANAKATLEAAGLKVTLASGSYEDGVVTAQSQSGGQAPKGSTITLTVKAPSDGSNGGDGANTQNGASNE